MIVKGIGTFENIDSFVKNKLELFANCNKDFKSLFDFMFSESDNIMYEFIKGYRIHKMTYKEVKTEILKKAIFFTKNYSIEKNSIVGIYISDNLDFIISLWIVLICGYRPLLLNTRVSIDDINCLLKALNVKNVISDGKEFDGNTYIYEKIQKDDSLYDVEETGSDILLITSGTTGTPKVCAYSAQELYYQIVDSYNLIRKNPLIKEHYNGYIKHLLILPFYHIFGLVAVYIWFGFFSRTFVKLNDFSSSTIVNTVKRHNITHIFAVPLFWENVYKNAIKGIEEIGIKTKKRFDTALKISLKISNIPVLSKLFKKIVFSKLRDKMFGDSIKFLVSGGSEIDLEALKFFNGIGYHLVNGYGMSEIGITSVEVSRDAKYYNSGFVGKPLSSVEYKIDKESILLVKGKTLARYIMDNGKTVRLDSDTWFKTNDIAKERKGHYIICGRRDDIVISAGGENVSPYTVESKIKVVGVRNTCLINNKANNLMLSLLIVSINNYISSDYFKSIDLNIKDILKKESLVGLVDKIVYVTDALVEEDEFKINRKRIREKYENNLLHLFTISNDNSDQVGLDVELLDRVRKYFSIALSKDINEISNTANFFFDFGGSSLEFFALVASIEEEEKIKINKDISTAPQTVIDMYNYLKEYSV